MCIAWKRIDQVYKEQIYRRNMYVRVTWFACSISRIWVWMFWSIQGVPMMSRTPRRVERHIHFRFPLCIDSLYSESQTMFDVGHMWAVDTNDKWNRKATPTSRTLSVSISKKFRVLICISSLKSRNISRKAFSNLILGSRVLRSMPAMRALSGTLMNLSSQALRSLLTSEGTWVSSSQPPQRLSSGVHFCRFNCLHCRSLLGLHSAGCNQTWIWVSYKEGANRAREPKSL